MLRRKRLTWTPGLILQATELNPRIVSAAFVLSWIAAYNREWPALIFIVAVGILATIRMHRFALYYGREFFSCARALKHKEEKGRD